jgi:hypothetical protein
MSEKFANDLFERMVDAVLAYKPEKAQERRAERQKKKQKKKREGKRAKKSANK